MSPSDDCITVNYNEDDFRESNVHQNKHIKANSLYSKKPPTLEYSGANHF